MPNRLWYYGQQFQTFPAGRGPTKPQQFENLAHVKVEYEFFLKKCHEEGKVALPYHVYFGWLEGIEETYGYPAYPDFIFHPTGEDLLTSWLEVL